ncbi:hypothetical protein [Streptomyces sp. NPDC006997]|uniref:hypothetical protein n=1 Tax=Streptomyces sp. NPDC006997 TaxID=3155356 RepID=UPI0033F3C3CE
MAKNKNRDRKQSQPERARQDAQDPAMVPSSEERLTPTTPGDVARKGRQKRFGHN